MALPQHLGLEMHEIERIIVLLCDVHGAAWGLALCLDQEGRIPRLCVFVDEPISDRVAEVAAFASDCGVERIVLVHPAGGDRRWTACEMAALRETLGIEIQSEEFTRRDKSC
jgi:hypothetical protein